MKKNKVLIIICLSSIVIGLLLISRFFIPDIFDGLLKENKSVPLETIAIIPISPSTTVEYQSTQQPIIIAAMSDSQLTQILSSIQRKDCLLPCFMGIIPGKTTVTQAQDILNYLNLNIVKIVENNVERTIMGSLVYSIDESQKSTYQDTRTDFGIGLIIGNEVVQQIRVFIRTDAKPGHEFYSYWSRYTPLSVLSELGVPDVIEVSLTSIKIGYQKQGVLLSAGLYRYGEEFCPDIIRIDKGNIDVLITNPEYHIDLLPNFYNSTETVLWKPVEDRLGINERTFYDRFMKDHSICFPYTDMELH